MSVARIASEFLVNSDPADVGGAPVVAGRSDGRYLIAWEGLLNGSDNGHYSNNTDILGRMFQGNAALATDFRINTEIRDGQFDPTVAAGIEGFVVAYRSGEENALPGSYAASQLVAANGQIYAPEQFGSGYTSYNNSPSADFLFASNFALTTTQEDDFEARVRSSDSTETSFHFGAYGTQSTVVALDTNFQIGTTTFQLFWNGYASLEDARNDGEYGVYTQKANAGGLIGSPVQLSDSPFNLSVDRLVGGNIVLGGLVFNPATNHIDGGALTNGSVAALDDGGYVVVTMGSDGDGTGVFAQIYDSTGATAGAKFQVNELTEGDVSAAAVAAIGNDDFVVTWRGADGVKATTFSADGVDPDDAVLINSMTVSDQIDAFSTRLNNGNVVVVWTDYSEGITPRLTQVRGQIVDPNGNRIGGEFTVSAPEAGITDHQPSVTANPDGGFTVVWGSGDDDLDAPPQATLQKYTSSGAAVGGPLKIDVVGFTGDPLVASIGGGRTVVVNRDVDAETFINVTVVNAKGEFVSISSIDDQLSRGGFDLTALKGGGFAVTYVAPEGYFGEPPFKAHIATYAASGALISDQLIGSAEGYDQSAAKITALAQGGFVAVYDDADGMKMQLYSEKSVKIGGPVSIGVGAIGDVAALADGRYAVAWQTGGSDATTLHSQVFTVEGDKSGAEQTHVVDPEAFRFVTLTGAGDHGYAMTYSGDGNSGDGSASAVRGLFYTADNLVRGGVGSTSALGDTVYAGNGNDVVNALAGDDLVYGENGSDTVHGGAGNDLIYGGNQIDTLFGDADNDVIVGDVATIGAGSRAAGDQIDGGIGNDTLYGDGYVILSGGFGGRDTIRGGGGNDIVYGDARTLQAGATGGNDTLFGDAGDDIIFGDGEFVAGSTGGADRIDGGAGSDTLWGGGGNDVFVFSTAGDFGRDVIQDFGQAAGNRDLIDLRAIGTSFTQLSIDYQDGNTIIYSPFQNEGWITLIGTYTLGGADFLF